MPPQGKENADAELTPEQFAEFKKALKESGAAEIAATITHITPEQLAGAMSRILAEARDIAASQPAAGIENTPEDHDNKRDTSQGIEEELAEIVFQVIAEEHPDYFTDVYMDDEDLAEEDLTEAISIAIEKTLAT
ncbi:hypothetical protein EES43_26715 [Streptomyces sp. ADI96-02]|nr:hypothetical protein EES43_26715 [Streptomyces sp. ADI96-02]